MTERWGIAMITDTEINTKAFIFLSEYLGDVEAERFITLIQREPFDYTKWRQTLEEDLSIEEISRKAMLLRKRAEGIKNAVPRNPIITT